MGTKFNFNSQICTNRVQSEHLIALGLKKETADCAIYLNGDNEFIQCSDYWGWKEQANIFPSWSMSRLIEMMPDLIKDNIEGMLYHLSIDGNSVFYETRSADLCQFFGDNLYICIIDCIEWLIKEGYFNKEYLV